MNSLKNNLSKYIRKILKYDAIQDEDQTFDAMLKNAIVTESKEIVSELLDESSKSGLSGKDGIQAQEKGEVQDRFFGAAQRSPKSFGASTSTRRIPK